MSRGPCATAKAYIWVCVIVVVLMHCILVVNLPDLLHNLF